MNSSNKVSKDQIKAAEEILQETLNNKKEQKAKEEFEKDIKKIIERINKHNGIIDRYNENCKLFKKEMESKSPGIEVDLNDIEIKKIEIPKDINDIGTYGNPISLKRERWGKRQNDTYGMYTPDFTQIENEVKEFIFNLKLGTALMADIKKVLTKINNL